MTLPGSLPTPVAESWLNVTLPSACSVWLPLLTAVPTKILRPLPAVACAVKVPLAPVAVPAMTLSSVRLPLPSTSTLPLTADSRFALRFASAPI